VVKQRGSEGDVKPAAIKTKTDFATSKDNKGDLALRNTRRNLERRKKKGEQED